jgi:hypothetical protein
VTVLLTAAGLLLVAAVARAGLHPVRRLLVWWRLRAWLVVIALVGVLFAAADARHASQP